MPRDFSPRPRDDDRIKSKSRTYDDRGDRDRDRDRDRGSNYRREDRGGSYVRRDDRDRPSSSSGYRRDDRERERASEKRRYGYGEEEREKERRRDRERYDNDRERRSRSRSPRRRQASSPRNPRSRSRSASPSSSKNIAKPTFTPSGLLAAETNTVQSVDGKNSTVLKYNEPPEARKPVEGWRLYVFKDNQDGGGKAQEEVEILHIQRQSAYLFGRDRLVADIPIDHPSCSKQHAVIQYRLVQKKDEYGGSKGIVKPFIIDLNSTNGTHVNGDQIPASSDKIRNLKPGIRIVTRWRRVSMSGDVRGVVGGAFAVYGLLKVECYQDDDDSDKQ